MSASKGGDGDGGRAVRDEVLEFDVRMDGGGSTYEPAHDFEFVDYADGAEGYSV